MAQILSYLLRVFLITCYFFSQINNCNGSPLLLFATNKDIRVANVSRSSKVISIVKDLSESSTLDFYYEKGLVCWSDIGLELIQCIQTNGTHTQQERITVVNASTVSPDGLACDWYTGKLYWTDGEKNRIEVSSIDGKYRKVLFWTEIYSPRAIAVVPMRSILFWTDWGDVPKIERASMNGDPSSRKVVVADNIFWPNGLTIDYDNELVYWTDGKYRFIAVMDYYGRNRRNIVSEGLDYPFAITYFDQRLYWTDWKTWCIHSLDLRSSNAHPRELFHGEYVPSDIEVWDSRRQPQPLQGSNPCKVNNGNCSHLCLLSTKPPGYSCACPTGVKLIDNHTCANGTEKLLLIVQRTEISKISLDSPDYTNFVIPLSGVKHAIAIDFDPIDEMFYWTDEQAHSIRRAYLDGSGQEDIVTDEVKSPDGIAVDWITRNLYWTDTGTDRIEVARLNGSHRKVLIHEDLGEPRAIALALELGWMFWSDWDHKKPKIERSNLDGSERQILISKDIIWPNGIALDLDRRKLYWCDAKTDKIEVCDMDGTNRREVITENLPHLFGFSLLGDYLYWTDWQRRSIDRAHKSSGADRETIIEQIPNVMGLKAIHRGKPRGTNLCARNNGGCSQLCLNRPNSKYVCACEINYELKDDMKTCYIPEAFLLFSKKEVISRASIDHGNVNAIPIANLKDTSALDYDLVESRIYWTDSKLKTISSAFLNGSDVLKVIDLGLETPNGLGIDWITRNIYWCDSGTKRIEVSKIDGSYRKVLIWENLIEPKSLIVDPRRGHIYWTEWGRNGSIERAWMDGSNREVILNLVGKTNGLTIDHVTQRLYWADLTKPAIESYDLITKTKVALVTQKIEYPNSVIQYKDYVYWTDWNTGDIERVNKTTGGNRTKIHENVASVSNLLVYHDSKKPVWNSCSINNGGCSHLCFPTPSNNGDSSHGHKCGCPTHYSLSLDNKTCLGPQNFMVYSSRNMMGRFLPGSNDCPDIVLRIQGLKNVRSIEFDPITQYVYWISDGRIPTIKKAMENKSQILNVLSLPSGTGHFFDMALDPLGRQLFWSSSMNDAINVTRLDDNNSAVGVVVQGEGEKPRNIAVHPEERLLFWTDLGENMRVVQSFMDGSERVVIAANLETPTSLAVDTTANLVYWSHGRQIEFAEIGGANRKMLVTVVQDSVVHLSVLYDQIYWFDRDSQSVERVDKTSGFVRKSIMTIKSLTDLVTVKTTSELSIKSHVCSPFNHYDGCSHICIGTKTVKCSCPLSLVLSDDNKTCRSVPACTADHFKCVSPKIPLTKKCIPINWKCDGQKDCIDGSDELGCPPCDREMFFECRNGLCIDNSFVCDGTRQCTDGSDEINCCNADQFRCSGTGACISINALCDGWENCSDGSDESAPACASANNHRLDADPVMESGKGTWVVSVFIVTIASVAVVFGFFYCRRKLAGNEDLPDILHDSAGDPLSPKCRMMKPSSLVHKYGRKDLKNGLAVRMSTLNGSSISSSYERSHITGFSYCPSSSTRGSSAGGYPQETLNPPPSPATTANSTRCSSSNASRHRPYRNYRMINQPPPPTPCSTDICDESDSNYPPRYGWRYGYGGEPFPPPPTPRSVYQSDTAISCPPSPSSRSSTYFSPLPPPPSPVP